MFKDRYDAGRQLAKELLAFREENPLVLAIPRGGVAVAFEIAKLLNAQFSLIITRKLPFPYNPESGFGAIAEDGSIVILRGASSNLSPKMIETVINNQKEEIQRRIKILRGGRPIPELNGRTIILVDDGIAMGSTMRAAIMMCKKQEPDKIVVASPVGSPELTRALQQKEAVDQTVILKKPRFFRAVSQVYEKWYDVPDYEVLSIMNEWHNEHAKSR